MMYAMLSGISHRDAMTLLAQGRFDLLAKNAARIDPIHAYAVLRYDCSPKTAWYTAWRMHRQYQRDMMESSEQS